MREEVLWEGRPSKAWLPTSALRAQLGLAIAALCVSLPFVYITTVTGSPGWVPVYGGVVSVFALLIGPFALWRDRRLRAATTYSLTPDGLRTQTHKRETHTAIGHGDQVTIERHPGGFGSIWLRTASADGEIKRLICAVSEPDAVKAKIKEASCHDTM